MNSLSPARHPTETFPNYQARRKLVHKRVAQLLGGQWFHKSCEIFNLPDIGKDNNVDGLVSRGDLIVVERRVIKQEGKEDETIRIAKSKGASYKRTEPKPKRIGFLRRQARKSTPLIFN